MFGAKISYWYRKHCKVMVKTIRMVIYCVCIMHIIYANDKTHRSPAMPCLRYKESPPPLYTVTNLAGDSPHQIRSQRDQYLISTARCNVISITYAKSRNTPHCLVSMYPFMGTTTSVTRSRARRPRLLLTRVGVKYRLYGSPPFFEMM